MQPAYFAERGYTNYKRVPRRLLFPKVRLFRQYTTGGAISCRKYKFKTTVGDLFPLVLFKAGRHYDPRGVHMYAWGEASGEIPGCRSAHARRKLNALYSGDHRISLIISHAIPSQYTSFKQWLSRIPSRLDHHLSV